jgi:hypothetical protein
VVVVMGVGAVVDEADMKVPQAMNWRHECTDAMFA